ncbi:MAG: MoaD/ThiS family protein [Sphingomonadaceae bacterium]|nr:MoaD/ThiS family protein [Sphingomonadaceae bacterium]
MSLKLVFLGRLADAAQAPERAVETVPSIASLLAGLEPDLSAMLGAEKIKIAVNGKIVVDRAVFTLRDGDEVAFLPPVSGG